VGYKFKLGRNILGGLGLSRTGPKWTNFGEIRSVRAESRNCGKTNMVDAVVPPSEIEGHDDTPQD
jgi:hypothetical protein